MDTGHPDLASNASMEQFEKTGNALQFYHRAIDRYVILRMSGTQKLRSEYITNP